MFTRQEVKVLREEVSAEESRYHYLNSMTHLLQCQQERIQHEMKAYVSSDPQEKKKTLRYVWKLLVYTEGMLSMALV